MSTQTSEDIQSSGVGSNPFGEPSDKYDKNDVDKNETDASSSVVKRHDFLFKLIMLGDTQTGKTNLLSRWSIFKWKQMQYTYLLNILTMFG